MELLECLVVAPRGQLASQLKFYRWPNPRFQDDFDSVCGIIYHLGNPSLKDDSAGRCFFAYRLLSEESRKVEADRVFVTDNNGYARLPMDTREAVILAVEWLLRLHRSDLQAAHHVTVCFLPNFGHGDDIWMRTEAMHVLAEVTTSGADERWRDVKGPKRKTIKRKIQALKGRTDATHRYLFVVGELLAKALQSAEGEGVVVVPLLLVASPAQPLIVAEEPVNGAAV